MTVYKKLIIGISGFSTLAALVLIIIELGSAGTCPPFPLFGFPTCYLVLVLYAVVLGSQFIRNQLLGSQLFWASSLIGILTTFWFSTDQLIGLSDCPKLYDFPLCYVALLGWILLMWLKGKDTTQSEKISSTN